MEFEHPRINEEVEAIGGHYIFLKEELLEHVSGSILYLVGCAVTDRSCCGTAGCAYAVVAGRVVDLRTRKADGDAWISVVEPVPEEFHEEIACFIRSREGIAQVHFLMEGRDRKVLF